MAENENMIELGGEEGERERGKVEKSKRGELINQRFDLSIAFFSGNNLIYYGDFRQFIVCCFEFYSPS